MAVDPPRLNLVEYVIYIVRFFFVPTDHKKSLSEFESKTKNFVKVER